MKYNRLYVGHTSNLEARLLSHNELGKKDWTTKYRPWTLVCVEVFESKQQAMLREKQLKGGQGRASLKNVLREKGLISA